MLTDNAGKVDIEVPRDRDGTFTPMIVPKRQRRLSDVDAVVLSRHALTPRIAEFRIGSADGRPLPLAEAGNLLSAT